MNFSKCKLFLDVDFTQGAKIPTQLRRNQDPMAELTIPKSSFGKNHTEKVTRSPDAAMLSFRLNACKEFESVKNETVRFSLMENLNCSSIDYKNYNRSADPIQMNETLSFSQSSIFVDPNGKIDPIKFIADYPTNNVMGMFPKGEAGAMNGSMGGYGMENFGMGGMGPMMGGFGMGGMNPMMGGMNPIVMTLLMEEVGISIRDSIMSGPGMDPMMGGVGIDPMMGGMDPMMSGVSPIGMVEAISPLNPDPSYQTVIPHFPIKYDLIDWDVLEGCLSRIEYLNEHQNCFSDPAVTDINSCSANGCIYKDNKCFFCAEAITNQMENEATQLNSGQFPYNPDIPALHGVYFCT